MFFVNVHEIIIDRLALSDIEHIEERRQRFRVIRTRAAADDKRRILPAVFGVNTDLRQIKELQNIRVTHFILDGNGQEVKHEHRVLAFQSKKRNLFLPHDLVKIHPRRENALAPDIVPAVHLLVDDLHTQVRHANLVDVRKGHGKPDIHLFRVFDHTIHLMSDVTDRLFDF